MPNHGLLGTSLTRRPRGRALAKTMKKQLIYEAFGMISALVGAFLLIGVLMPVINPGMFEVRTGRDGMPLLYYFVAIPIPLFVLAVAWVFNRKAQRLKRDEEPAANQQIHPIAGKPGSG